MSKIIIFGGSFDPIHVGHVKIGLKAFNKIKADKLIFVPTNNHPEKKELFASNQDRIEMIKIAIQDIENFEIDDFEMKQKSTNFTIDTIHYFLNKYPNDEIYLLIGKDQFVKFKQWYKYEEILKLVKLIVCYRGKEVLNHDIKHFKISKLISNISSSQIRNAPKKSNLNEKVLDYINNKGIYAKLRIKNNLSEYRYQHSLRVAELAIEICDALKLDVLKNRAYVAAIYHDYAKEMTKDELVKIAKKLKIKDYPSWKVLHGPVGAYLINKKFFIKDKNVLDAIENHVIPIDRSSLTKIIYCADKLDIRNDGSIEQRNELLKLCKTNLNEGFLKILNIVQKYETSNRKENKC